MTWLDRDHLLAALVLAATCALLGSLVPQVLRRLPEPQPDPGPDADAPTGPAIEADADLAAEPVPAIEPGAGPVERAEPKELYADMAGLPRLSFGTALAGAVAGAIVGDRLGWTGVLLPWALLVPVGVLLALVDWRTRLLPTRVIAPTYPALVVLVGLAALLDHDRGVLVGAALGWLVMGGTYLLLWFAYPRGLGYGDVRLSGLLGLALGAIGWPQLLVGAYAGFLLGAVGGLLLSRLGIVHRKHYPFGPFMVLGTLVGVLWGPAVITALGY